MLIFSVSFQFLRMTTEVVPTRPSTRAPITACIGRAFQNQKPLPCKQTYLSVATTWLRRIDSAWTSSPLADATGRLRLLGEHQSELASTAAGLGDWGSKSRVLPPYPPYHSSSASGVVVLLPGRLAALTQARATTLLLATSSRRHATCRVAQTHT